MIGVGLAIIVVGIVLVHRGWRGRRAMAVTGWAAADAGLILLVLRDGAWGLAVGTMAGMAAGLALVLYAGWTSPAKLLRPPREAPSVALTRRWPELGRRLAVFLLVVPVAFAAGQWFAFGAQAVARRAGAGDADAIVLTLFLQPFVWGVIMTVQMTRPGTLRMLAAPVVAALLGTVLWSLS